MSVERSRTFFVRFRGKTAEPKLVIKLSTKPADRLPFRVFHCFKMTAVCLKTTKKHLELYYFMLPVTMEI